MLILIAIFVVFAVGLFALVAGFDKRGEKARVLHERLSAVDRAAARNASEELALLRDELVSGIPALNRLLSRSARVRRLQRYLLQAEIRMRPGAFLLLSSCVAVMAALVTLKLGAPLMFVALAAIAAGVLPIAYVSIVRSRRFRRFEIIFPEAIDLLGRAIRAGHSFSTSLELIGNELSEPVSGEFRKLYEEQKFGLPMRDALLNFAERIPIFDVKFFVTAVMLQRETGGNLAEILDKLSYLIRERFKILRQVRVYTAQGRLTMAILMFLPVGMGVALFGLSPQYIGLLFTDPIGHMLIFMGIVMETIGFFVIRKIIHIRV